MMYKPTPIDRNIIKQPWFNAMTYEHSQFLLWLFLDDMDSIGIVEPNMDDFEKYTKGIVTKNDIDFDRFVDDCNNDRKERMRFVDRGRKLWFTPTVLFKNATNSGFRTLSSSERDAAIMRSFSEREETRDWLIDQLIYNDRLTIKEELVNKVWNRTDATRNEQELMERIASHIGYKISKGKKNPKEIKKRYGCVCQYCGEVFREDQLDIDHVYHKSTGHKDVNSYWNLVPCCKPDNIEKGIKPVFLFLKEKGYDPLPGVENAIKKWIKKGVLKYPTQYPYKRNNKEKLYSWDQVVDWVSTHSTTSTDQYECVNPEESKEERKWKRI